MNFKKISILMCLTFLSLLFSSCSNTSSNVSTSQPTVKTLNIVTSFYPMYLHTINITKDIPNVKVINMTKPQTGCLHDYTLTTDDMKTLESAQIFVVNGVGMEQFMDKIVKQLPNLKVIEATQNIPLIKNEDDTENPHVWVSITNAIKQVQNISDQLATNDPQHSTQYKNNTATYIKKLETQRTKMHDVLDKIQNRNIVTFHEAFPYFAKEFNLNIVAIIEREPGTEPNAKELEDTIKLVKSSNVKALFAEPQYPEKSAQAIAKETGAKLYALDPAVTGESNGEYDAYLKIMNKNLDVLSEALK